MRWSAHYQDDFLEGFPAALVVENMPADEGEVRDADSVSELGGFPGEGNGNPLQCSCLESPMDRGAWRVTVHGVTKSRTRLTGLSTRPFLPPHKSLALQKTASEVSVSCLISFCFIFATTVSSHAYNLVFI